MLTDAKYVTSIAQSCAADRIVLPRHAGSGEDAVSDEAKNSFYFGGFRMGSN